MRHWEKTKKDNKRNDDRGFEADRQDAKKKKLKPVEKTKYRLRATEEEEE